MNELQIFNNPDFGEIRTLEEDGKILFCAKDVAQALGYKDTTNAIKQHCRWVVKRHLPHPQSPEKTIEVNFIPEGDVYRLVASSNLPGAERFESWIFDEVVPSIRKTGGYFAGSKELQAIFMLDSRTVEHEQRITALEGSMVIDYGQQRTLADLVNDTVVKALGGKDSAAYTDKSIRGKTYCEINRDLQRWFRVNSRNNIPRKRFDEAAEYIQRWHPSMNVAMLIRQANLQEVILEV